MKNKHYIAIFVFLLLGCTLFFFLYPFFVQRKSYNEELKTLRNIVQKDQRVFESMLKRIEDAPTLEKKYIVALNAIDYTRYHSIGYFSSDILEDVFLTMAQALDFPLSDDFEPNSTLHVASELYSHGGHSRALERWIENSSDDEKHSVFLTRPSYISERLIEAVDRKNGEIYQVPKKISLLERTTELRKIASRYERIVLHIHMDDYIPLLAFGTEKFKRPVFLFNHADHRFWLGVSIADCIISLSTRGYNFSKDYRGGLNNCLLPLPIDKKSAERPLMSKLELRRKLKLPEDKKIIFASGSSVKFEPMLQYNFANFIEKIAKKRSDVFFLIIGPKNLEPNISPDRFLAIKVVPNDVYRLYLASADLVIDSFPMTGATAMIDAISMGIPVLSTHTPTGQADYIVHSNAYTHSIDELVDKTLLVLDNPHVGISILSQITDLLEKETDVNNWLKQKKDIYSRYKTHAVHQFKPVKKTVETYDELDFFLTKQ